MLITSRNSKILTPDSVRYSICKVPVPGPNLEDHSQNRETVLTALDQGSLSHDNDCPCLRLLGCVKPSKPVENRSKPV